MRPTFSLIIPTRNRSEVLARNLRRLCGAADELPGELEILVADNASTDGTADLVASQFPGVRLFRLDRNRSTAARNVAAESARGPILVMLDDDSFIGAADLLRMKTVLRNQPEVHSVAARVRRTGSPHRHEGGGLPGVFIGCGAAVRRDVFLELGGYPDDYGYYVEEYDFCIRVWQNGGRVRWYEDVVVYHEGGGGGRDVNRIVRHLTRNNLRLWSDFAPTELREALMFETVERYARMARRELAQAGFVQGLTEAAHLLPPSVEAYEHSFVGIRPEHLRCRMSMAEFRQLYGLDDAERIIAAACGKRACRRVAMWGRGKGAEQLVRLMTEMDHPPQLIFDPVLDEDPREGCVTDEWYGLEVLPGSAIISRLPDVLVIGSLSPGACRDLAALARRAALNTTVVEPLAWWRTDKSRTATAAVSPA